MTSTRALTKLEGTRVRQRLQQLVDELGSQTAAARATGMSQQVISRILAGDPVGRSVAKQLADYEGLSVEELLSGKTLPHALRDAIRKNPGRWHDMAIAAVREGASKLAGAANIDVDGWSKVLDRIEDALEPIIRDMMRRGGK